ncbi:hypothetical protein BJV78DRAFT_1253392 [Lactifluus subvellereus]|nr:hypothetical protein BJV78DRAFT_1253392 [Lactifluus subvellereus]
MIPVGDVSAEDLLNKPWISASGAILANSEGNLGVFDIDPSQYVSAFKDAPGIRPLFPIRACIDLSSKRYSHNKPTLKPNQFISITGHLSHIQAGQSPNLNRFCVEVENFDFLSFAPPPTAASPSPSVTNDTPLKPKMKFSFGAGSMGKKRKLDQTVPSSSTLFTS